MPIHNHGGMPLDEMAAADAWVFDLDNTLYPWSTRLFVEVDRRIGGFIANLMGVDAAEARRIQKHYFAHYGTTLRGLMTLHGIEPEAYMEYVHDIDVTAISANPRLDAALALLPGRKLVFTNASVPHAHRVMGRLGVLDRFDGIFDIVAANYIPKPQPGAYRDLVRRYGLDPARCVMVEDMACNLEPASALGMTTVWVRNENEWGRAGSTADHVHHVADDLTDWLEAVALTRKNSADR